MSFTKGIKTPAGPVRPTKTDPRPAVQIVPARLRRQHCFCVPPCDCFRAAPVILSPPLPETACSHTAQQKFSRGAGQSHAFSPRGWRSRRAWAGLRAFGRWRTARVQPPPSANASVIAFFLVAGGHGHADVSRRKVAISLRAEHVSGAVRWARPARRCQAPPHVVCQQTALVPVCVPGATPDKPMNLERGDRGASGLRGDDPAGLRLHVA